VLAVLAVLALAVSLGCGIRSGLASR
jgi:hypothetical protein